MDNNRYELSHTVQDSVKKLGDEPTCAANFARMILSMSNHREEYAKGKFISLELLDTEQERTLREWLDQIQLLFNPDKLGSGGIALIHGRLVIIGLCLLDRRFYDQLEQVEAFDALVDELWYQLPAILSEEGERLFAELRPSRIVAESVSSLTDDPLTDPMDDLLGRNAFARFLVRRLEIISEENLGAYAFHLYAPWGAGKSTLLNFMRTELEREKKWMVVEFNAW
jgi:hypothetical protein